MFTLIRCRIRYIRTDSEHDALVLIRYRSSAEYRIVQKISHLNRGLVVVARGQRTRGDLTRAGGYVGAQRYLASRP